MPKILNNIFISLLVLFLAFCWLMYYTKSFELSFGIALTLSLLCCLLLQMLSKKPSKREKQKIKKNKLLALQTHLTFSNKNYKLFSSVFEKCCYSVKKIDENSFKATKEQKSVFVCWHFDFEPLTSSSVVSFSKAAAEPNAGKTIVLCNSASKNSFFAANSAPLPTEIWQIEEVFLLLQRNSLLPNLPEKTKKPPRILLSFALSKKRFGYYLGSAFFLLAFSLISYFPIYSLVWATVMFLIAVYSLTNKRFNTSTGDTKI